MLEVQSTCHRTLIAQKNRSSASGDTVFYSLFTDIASRNEPQRLQIYWYFRYKVHKLNVQHKVKKKTFPPARKGWHAPICIFPCTSQIQISVTEPQYVWSFEVHLCWCAGYFSESMKSSLGGNHDPLYRYSSAMIVAYQGQEMWCYLHVYQVEKSIEKKTNTATASKYW